MKVCYVQLLEMKHLWAVIRKFAPTTITTWKLTILLTLKCLVSHIAQQFANDCNFLVMNVENIRHFNYF